MISDPGSTYASAPMRLSSEPHDATLIERTRAGEPDALAALYERYARPIIGLAYRITGSMEDAEDVLHDVFLGLPETLHRYEERGNFEGWLKRVAARVALTRIRTRSRRREVAMTPLAEPATEASDNAVANQAALEQAIAALPDNLRVVFVLKEIEGYSHAEIASLLGIKTGTSEVRLCRAVKKLRKLLRDLI